MADGDEEEKGKAKERVRERMEAEDVISRKAGGACHLN